MATLKQIRRRIRSVRSTRHITKAMQMVAAAKLRRAQASALAARPYALALEDLLGRLAGATAVAAHPLCAVRDAERVLLAVVASDKGLCGSFNSSILREAEGRIAQLGRARVTLVPIGRRAWQHFQHRAWDCALGMERLGDLADQRRAQELAQDLMRRFQRGEVDRVEFIGTHFVSLARRSVERVALLPVAPAARVPWGVPHLFEPDAASVLAALLPRYVAMRIYAILADSIAAEHAARMMAMSNASRNAGEMISALTLTANKLRQAAITRELTELVGGAGALE